MRLCTLVLFLVLPLLLCSTIHAQSRFAASFVNDLLSGRARQNELHIDSRTTPEIMARLPKGRLFFTRIMYQRFPILNVNATQDPTLLAFIADEGSNLQNVTHTLPDAGLNSVHFEPSTPFYVDNRSSKYFVRFDIQSQGADIYMSYVLYR